MSIWQRKNYRNLQITELYLVKADWNRTFMAQIIREKTEDGKEIIRGNVLSTKGKHGPLADQKMNLVTIWMIFVS